MKRSEETISKQKQTLKETRSRHKNMVCKVLEFKIDSSHLSSLQPNHLNDLFFERKRYYNHILGWLNEKDSQENKRKLKDFDTKSNDILVKGYDKTTKESFVVMPSTITSLTAKMKQDVVADIKNSFKSLSALKKKGRKIGGLGFAKSCNSLSLSQYGNSYEFIKVASGKYKLRLSINHETGKGLTVKKQKFKLISIHGSNQIKPWMEFTSAKLVRKPSGFYIHATVYLPQEDKPLPKKHSIGLDFGIKNTLTTSEGKTWNIRVPESARLKLAQKKLARQTGTENCKKTKQIIQKEYEKLDNKKEDIANKIVSELKKEYEVIVFQDDNFTTWKNNKGMSRAVQHSVLGRLKSKLRASDQGQEIDRYMPTTKLCDVCLKLNNCPLGQEIYRCKFCGNEKDRDIKGAIVTELFGTERIIFDKTSGSYQRKPENSKTTPTLETELSFKDYSLSDGVELKSEIIQEASKF